MKIKKRPRIPNYSLYFIKLKNNIIILKEISVVISY